MQFCMETVDKTGPTINHSFSAYSNPPLCLYLSRFLFVRGVYNSERILERSMDREKRVNVAGSRRVGGLNTTGPLTLHKDLQ